MSSSRNDASREAKWLPAKIIVNPDIEGLRQPEQGKGLEVQPLDEKMEGVVQPGLESQGTGFPRIGREEITPAAMATWKRLPKEREFVLGGRLPTQCGCSCSQA